MFVTVYYFYGWPAVRAVLGQRHFGRLPAGLMLPFFQLLAQCLVREWRSVMAIIERELYLENTKAASFFPTVTV